MLFHLEKHLFWLLSWGSDLQVKFQVLKVYTISIKTSILETNISKTGSLREQGKYTSDTYISQDLRVAQNLASGFI